MYVLAGSLRPTSWMKFSPTCTRWTRKFSLNFRQRCSRKFAQRYLAGRVSGSSIQQQQGGVQVQQ
jgi:hypothetical protein